jgi:hypothetical protein
MSSCSSMADEILHGVCEAFCWPSPSELALEPLAQNGFLNIPVHHNHALIIWICKSLGNSGLWQVPPLELDRQRTSVPVSKKLHVTMEEGLYVCDSTIFLLENNLLHQTPIEICGVFFSFWGPEYIFPQSILIWPRTEIRAYIVGSQWETHHLACFPHN